jgi:hypothetical protein
LTWVHGNLRKKVVYGKICVEDATVETPINQF